MKLDATLETRKKKDGTGEYDVVVIKLSEHSEKLVFLSPAEIELVKLHNKQTSKDSDFWAEIEN